MVALLPSPADAPLAAYLLAEPFLAGRVVLDVGPRPPRAAERLARAGAREIHNGEGPGPRFDLPDRSVDVALCVARLSACPTDVDRHLWLAEIRRVLRPEGFCLVRLPVSALGGEGARDALRAMVLTHFATCDLVAESLLVGVSYLVPDTEEAAVNEELASIAAEPTHLLALCAAGETRPWSTAESLLVPLGGTDVVVAAPEELAALREERESLEARLDAAVRERDGLREAAMTLQDRADAQEESLSALRRETERYLRQICDDAAALELGTLERERLERRAASVERALESQAAQLHQRTAELVALERELARLRGGRPPAPPGEGAGEGAREGVRVGAGEGARERVERPVVEGAVAEGAPGVGEEPQNP
jgi:hypothetical protein